MDVLSVEVVAALNYLRDACRADDARLRRLHEGAARNGGLLATDFFTLRDWLETAGYQDSLPLHALIILLMTALDEGSLCLEESEDCFRRRLETVIDSEDARWWAAVLARDLKTNAYERLIGADAEAGTPLVRTTIQQQPFLFFQKYERQERRFRDALETRLAAAMALPASVDMERQETILAEVRVDKPLRAGGAPLALDEDQCAALGLSLLEPLVLISGGPGTGKTSLVLTALRCLTRCGIPTDRIALAAPTGRAAQRLGDSLRAGLASLGPDPAPADAALAALAPMTLHRLLGYLPATGTFRCHRENPIAADVVVVDEVSMVGLTLMAQLFDALAPNTRLILLGDKDQLPSVEAGAVLAHIVPESFFPTFSAEVARRLNRLFPELKVPAAVAEGPLFDAQPLRDHVALLRVNHRSEGRIQDFAQALNRGDTTRLAALPTPEPDSLVQGDGWARMATDGGCWFLPTRTARPQELHVILESWFRHAYVDAASERGGFLDLVAAARLNAADDYDEDSAARLRDLFTLLDRARLLTLVRDGPWGCVDINRLMERLLRDRTGVKRRSALVPGAPVLVTRNDDARGLSNGDVGLVLATESGCRVVFARQDGFRSFPADALPGHEPGFALTVHKSQGSEYDEMFLVFPPEGARRLLTRELVYTAVTRARRLAVLHGKEEVVRQAITARVEREAGWLRTLHGLT
ncbi:MAG: exodeoxyribonuclease V subunit alpha [Gemmataceae bacterium]